MPTPISKPVLILGGGINGAALARELILNRVPVTLVDAADLASGATAYSSRLIHGGLRYLEYGEFDLVRESLAERRRLLALAPQFVRPLRLFIPVERRWGGLMASALPFLFRAKRKAASPRARGLWLVRLGLGLYDRYAGDKDLPRPTVARVGGESLPPVNTHAFRWLCSYYDAQVSFPERLVVALLADAKRLAAEYEIPFDVFTYAQARLSGDCVSLYATVEQGTTDEPAIAQIEPAAIVNATGAWVDRTLARLEVPSPRLIGGTKGSHFVTSHAELRRMLGGSGIYAEAKDGRPFFILPLGEATLVGTTDLPFDESPERAVATEQEIAYLLEGVNHVFPTVKLTRHEIDFHYSGVRPLPFVGAATPASVTRRHAVEEHADCAVPTFSIIGGKLTTCRSLAEEAAAVVLARLGQKATGSSRNRLLPGAESYPASESELKIEQEKLASETGLTAVQVEAVWRLVGTKAGDMLRDASGEPFSPADRASVADTDLPRGFVRRVIRDEWAHRLDDLVERRLMLLYDRRLSVAALRELANLLIEAGRSAEGEVQRQVQGCVGRLAEHYGKRVCGAEK